MRGSCCTCSKGVNPLWLYHGFVRYSLAKPPVLSGKVYMCATGCAWVHEIERCLHLLEGAVSACVHQIASPMQATSAEQGRSIGCVRVTRTATVRLTSSSIAMTACVAVIRCARMNTHSRLNTRPATTIRTQSHCKRHTMHAIAGYTQGLPSISRRAIGRTIILQSTNAPMCTTVRSKHMRTHIHVTKHNKHFHNHILIYINIKYYTRSQFGAAVLGTTVHAG